MIDSYEFKFGYTNLEAANPFEEIWLLASVDAVFHC